MFFFAEESQLWKVENVGNFMSYSNYITEATKQYSFGCFCSLLFKKVYLERKFPILYLAVRRCNQKLHVKYFAKN